MRNFWAIEYPVGDPFRGAPFGERTDPATVKGITPIMTGTGAILNLFGNIGSGRAARRSGEAQRTAANFEAAQLDQNAGQSVAAAQRAALDEKRRAALIASRGLAVAAASGGGASDPTVVKLLADIEGEGAYRAGVALYQGEERARQLRMAAEGKRYEGEVMAQGGRIKQRAYNIAGVSGLATGAASIYGKYGMGGPKKTGITSTSSDESWIDAGTEGYTSIG